MIPSAGFQGGGDKYCFAVAGLVVAGRIRVCNGREDPGCAKYSAKGAHRHRQIMTCIHAIYQRALSEVCTARPECEREGAPCECECVPGGNTVSLLAGEV